MSLPVILLGSGGHAKVVAEILQLNSARIIGCTSPETPSAEGIFKYIPYLGVDQIIAHYSPNEIMLVNGIGNVGGNKRRQELFELHTALGYTFVTVIHPSAIVSPFAQLDQGVQILAGAIIQAGSHIGSNTVINTRSSVDHDCHIGAHVHISPGVTLSGGVQVDDEVHVGAGATIIQNIKIGRGSIIGAGAVVIRDIPSYVTAVGVPARRIK